MIESKRTIYILIAISGVLIGLYCLYAATYNAWLTAYYTDKAHQARHANWFYFFFASAVLSFIMSGVLIYKIKKRIKKTTKNG